ncbi:MAG: hypothetical protein D4R43_04025 [Sphingobacteriales bacterium]|nr:MAG: hypothetical protein D4R43_04025 [Sphingobacteriales bacterium]
MKKKSVEKSYCLMVLLIIVLFGFKKTYAQSSFQKKTIDIGNTGMTISNFGTIGNPVIISNPDDVPSLEYPINSGIEHLFEGGLWIGASVNGQTVVSTASVDAASGYTTGAAGFEFSASQGSTINQRSTLTSNDHYSPDAISHQDFIMDFTDANTIVPGTSILITDHTTPLNAGVHLESYAWNYSFADYFVIFNYTITNNSTQTWDSVYLGMWTDLVVRNVNVATDNGSAFFSKGGVGYIDSLYALYAYDVNGDPGYTNSYGATQFLGIVWRDQFFHPHNASQFLQQGLSDPKVNANFWKYKTDDGFLGTYPADDLLKYSRLSTPLDFSNAAITNTFSSASNRTDLLSAGPLKEVLPGESFQYTIAVVCAAQLPGGTLDAPEARAELNQHLGWAKRTYLGEDVNENGILDAGEDLNNNQTLDRFILPEPPTDPIVKMIPTEGAVDIYWDDAAENSIDPISKKKDFEGYRIYRSNAGDDINMQSANNLNQIAQWDKPGNGLGFNNGFEPVKLAAPKMFEGDTTSYNYHYRVEGLLSGWQYVFAITSFDEGNKELNLQSLESSITANTYRVFAGIEGKVYNTKKDSLKPGVYPNPYHIQAAWDGSNAQTRRICFYNLPVLCTITIYTSAGDVASVLNHNENYKGEDAQWFSNYAGNINDRVLSGGEHYWDILSESKQAVSQGIYLFSVKDLTTGNIKTGSFVIER